MFFFTVQNGRIYFRSLCGVVDRDLHRSIRRYGLLEVKNIIKKVLTSMSQIRRNN